MHRKMHANGVGGLLHYFYLLDEWSILPSLIFMGVGAMTDFGPLIANPKSFPAWCSSTVWYLSQLTSCAILMGFNGQSSSSDLHHRWC